MFIPIGTDRPSKRSPVATEALIVVNMLVFLVGLIGSFAGWFDRDAVAAVGRFDPRNVEVWQLVSYQFIHDPYSIFHLAFNMLFLWVFGAPVERRLGRIGFIGFYLTAGVVAALGHSFVTQAPVIGASGSVAGVTGAFLALFPRSRIRVLIVFIFIGIVQIPALWFIGFYFAIDFLRNTVSMFGLGGADRVAYAAHLAGYVYGFALGFALLATGLLAHEDFDVFYLFKQARRRAAFKAASRGGPAGMFDSQTADTQRRLEKQRKKEARRAVMPPAHAELRARISRSVDQHDLPAAARDYRKLLELDPEATLSESRQLDVANQYFSEGEWATAATTYERLLVRYPHSPRGNEVRLILATIYARYLDRHARARELLEAVRDRVRDPDQRGLADQLLSELSS